MNNIFSNYDSFYNMVLSTTIMSNTHTPEFENDAKRIIDFIGKAFRLEGDLIERYKEIILDKVSSLGIIPDLQAIYSGRKYGNIYSEEDIVLDIKGDVLLKLQDIGEDNKENISEWFNYSHYRIYQSNVRFAQIKMASSSGNLITTRQTGILLALGIGCDVDKKEAIRRFFQCAFWGDIPSMYYLSYVYSEENDAKNEKIFYELARLSDKYLKSGYTVLPKDVSTDYSEEAKKYYIYISSIKQDIVYAYNRFSIDFSFLEAFGEESLDYYQKMYYINNYEKKEWKNITNSAERPVKALGF